MVKIMIESDGEKREIITDFAIIMSKSGEADESFDSATNVMGCATITEMLQMLAAGAGGIIDNLPTKLDKKTLTVKFIGYFADAMSGKVETEAVKNTITPVTGGD